MNKYFKIIFTIIAIFTLNSCQRNSFENYQNDISEILNPNSSNLRKIQDIADVKDMRGCGFKIELGIWQKDKILNKLVDKGIWSRSSSAYDHGIIGSGEQYIDFNKKNSTPQITKSPLHHIIYIGPWHYAKRVGKEIRFVAYTGWGGGYIFQQYESKTEENKNIPEKKFNLTSKQDITDRSGLCIVKWIANHGYNAIAEVEYKGFFNKIFRFRPSSTGKIIEVKE